MRDIVDRNVFVEFIRDQHQKGKLSKDNLKTMVYPRRRMTALFITQNEFDKITDPK